MVSKLLEINKEEKWKEDPGRKLAIIRIRGRVDVPPDIRTTLDILRLRRKHVCVVVPATRDFLGMIKKVESWVTWGEIDKETFKLLLMKRGRISMRKRLTEDYIKKKGFNSWDELVDYVWENPLKKLQELGIKPFFRLAPPKGGFERKGIKHMFHMGGAAGYRGKYINDLLRRMI